MASFLSLAQEERALRALVVAARDPYSEIKRARGKAPNRGYADEVAAVGYISTMFYREEKLWEATAASSRGPKGRTAIMAAAACHESTGRLQWLLKRLGSKKAAGIDAVDTDQGWSALHHSCHAGRADAALLLADEGACLELGDKRRKTPLYIACSEGHHRIVKALVEDYGVNVDAAASDGTRPIHACVKGGSTKTLKALLPADIPVDVQATDRKGSNALHYAAMHGRSKMIGLLCDAGVDREASNNDGDTPLHEACYQPSVEVVTELLKAGADPTAWNDRLLPDKRCWASPFRIACTLKNDEIAMALLDAGLSVDDDQEATLLHIACSNSRTAVVARLVSDGANVNCIDYKDATPIHAAASNTSAEGPALIELLARAGAVVDQCHLMIPTPLQRAAAMGCKANVVALVQCGAGVNKVGLMGRTALHSAVAMSNVATDIAPDFKQVTKNAQVLQYLVARGATTSINKQDARGDTPLHLACRSGVREFAMFLFEQGGSLDIKNVAGRTPLQVAKQYGHKGLATILEASDRLRKDEAIRAGSASAAAKKT
jgi:ankyrin repeat protein